jgi:hypothetical protein
MAWKTLLEALERLGLKEEAKEARVKFEEIQDRLRKSGYRVIPKF